MNGKNSTNRVMNEESIKYRITLVSIGQWGSSEFFFFALSRKKVLHRAAVYPWRCDVMLQKVRRETATIFCLFFVPTFHNRSPLKCSVIRDVDDDKHENKSRILHYIFFASPLRRRYVLCCAVVTWHIWTREPSVTREQRCDNFSTQRSAQREKINQILVALYIRTFTATLMHTWDRSIAGDMTTQKNLKEFFFGLEIRYWDATAAMLWRAMEPQRARWLCSSSLWEKSTTEKNSGIFGLERSFRLDIIFLLGHDEDYRRG